MTATPATTRDLLLAAARTELAEHGGGALSLRAVARRAGLSHSAPGHFFRDRSGLLTAVAADGFDELSAQLTAVVDQDERLAALGRAYVDFGIENPALIDVMFRRADLREDDPELQRAQRAAIEHLASAVAAARGESDAPSWTLLSWALVHGLVVLGREGALGMVAGDDDPDVARALVALYAAEVGTTT